LDCTDISEEEKIVITRVVNHTMQNKLKPRIACANVSENISSRDAQLKAGKCRAKQFTPTLRQTTLQHSAHFVHNRY
jgi:hypothetical protein